MNKLHYFNITYVCDSNCLFCAANVGIINHATYTMDVEDFEKKLLERNVQNGDRVMISGGEPTMSPYFWQILDVCEKNHCCIDLTTNGHFFSDEQNVKRILTYSSAVVRIPLFGIGNYHDYLTGRKGNYNKTMQALDNFSQVIRYDGITLNVKFLLCKATVRSNTEVYNMIYSRYGDLFEYSLSPILVSDKVRLNEQLLLAPYTELIKKTGNFIENSNLNCDIVPLCLLSTKKVNEFIQRKKISFDKMYADAQIQYEDMDNYWCDECKICKLNRYCDRFLPSYIDYYGTKEIKPFI